MKKKLVLIDGNSIAYRAFFALPLLHNDKGMHTNAIYGFTTMLMRVLEEERPTHILVAFDAGKTTFRHKKFKEYKGGRQKTPPELSEQFPFLRELLDAYGIKRYELENYEADDIIGTLAQKAEKEGYEVKIISGDKDLTQLSTDQITVGITRKGISDIEEYTPEHIREKYGLTPGQIIDMKGLMGDQSDNIPGVPGVGEKTAIKLLKQFKSIEKLLDSIDKVSGPKLKERLAKFKDQAILSKELATITTKAPVQIETGELLFEGYDYEQLTSLFQELGFNSLLDRLKGEGEEDESQREEIEYTIAQTIEEQMLTDQTALYLEIIEENYYTGEIVGFGLVNENGNVFLPAEIALQSDRFKKWAEDDAMKKQVYDAKRSIVSLKRHGIDLQGIDFDLLLVSYLLNPSGPAADFSGVAKRHGYTDVQTDEAVYGKGAKRKVAQEKVLAEHLVRKALAIKELYDPCLQQLEENEQVDLFYDLELPLTFILAKMEYTGVKVDVARLEEMQVEMAERLEKIEETIHELAGETFNVNSPKQLGVILFEKLGLPVIKKTKTGYSTAADVLEKLAPEHEIIHEILNYRQLRKLQSTYIEGLLKVVHSDTNKVHTRFNQALTQTGRLSSTDPNLQNIPIRLEEGRKIRQAFIPAEEDWIIFAADYSQIELRVLAHIAEDENLLEAFRNQMDIHTKTAMDVFHVSEDEVTPNMRRQAKAVNFGIIYGISDYGLSQNLGITRKEAGKFIDRYLESYPGVKNYMEEIVMRCKTKRVCINFATSQKIYT